MAAADESIWRVVHHVARAVVILNLGIIVSSFFFLKRKDVSPIEALVSGFRNPYYYFRGEYAPYCLPLLVLLLVAMLVMGLTIPWA